MKRERFYFYAVVIILMSITVSCGKDQGVDYTPKKIQATPKSKFSDYQEDEDITPDWDKRYPTVELEYAGVFEPRDSPVTLASPYPIRVRDDKLYAYDNENHFVGIFDVCGKYVTHYEQDEFAHDQIKGIDVDENENILLVGSDYIFLIIDSSIKKIKNLYNIKTGALYNKKIWVNGDYWMAGRENKLLRMFTYDFEYLDSWGDYLFDSKWGGIKWMRMKIASGANGIYIASENSAELLIVNNALSSIRIKDKKLQDKENANVNALKEFKRNNTAELYVIISHVAEYGGCIYLYLGGDGLSRVNSDGGVDAIYSFRRPGMGIVCDMDLGSCENNVMFFIIAKVPNSDYRIHQFQLGGR